MEFYRPSVGSEPIRWNWVTLVGPDAKDFLHRLTTANVKLLSVGRGSPGCFLTPQGKIRAYFTLWNTGQNEYSFEFDSGSSGKWKTELFALIDQYTFGEKITLSDSGSDLDSRWIFLEESELLTLGAGSLKAGETQQLNDQIRLCHHGLLDYGKLWITAWGKPAHLAQWVDQHLSSAEEISLEKLEMWRVLALRPRIDVEITETATPLELGLQDAIAGNKGCYPGQEVIEKIVALGSPAKRLARIDGKGTPPKPGELILSQAEPPVEVGQVTSSTSHQGQFTVLGIIRKIHAKEGLQVRFSEKKDSQGAIIKIAPYA